MGYCLISAIQATLLISAVNSLSNDKRVVGLTVTPRLTDICSCSYGPKVSVSQRHHINQIQAAKFKYLDLPLPVKAHSVKSVISDDTSFARFVPNRLSIKHKFASAFRYRTVCLTISSYKVILARIPTASLH